MAERDAAVENNRAESSPGPVRLVFAGMFFGGLFGAGAAAVETVIALFNGSYIPGEVVAVVCAWWTAAAAVGGAVLAIAALPVAVRLKGRARSALVAALVLAAGFWAHATNISANLSMHDPLVGTVALHPVFLAAWGAVLALIFSRLCISGRYISVANWYLAALGATLFSTGVAHFVWGAGSSFAITLGPLFLLAAIGLIMERVARPANRRLLPAAALAAFAAVLPESPTS
jgi:hypothetical protein